MSASFDYLKTLEAYIGKFCKIVYRDGGDNSPAKAFYGVLIKFDQTFQLWEGAHDPKSKEKFRVAFNHADVSRVVMELGVLNA